MSIKEMEQAQALSLHIPISRLQAKEGERREYGVSFISAGRVRSRDGGEADWEIPADTIKAAADLMSAKPVFVDHARGSFFDPGYPSMKDLAAVTFDAEYNQAAQTVEGGIRMYDNPVGLAMTALFDDILTDAAAGKEVPDVGLSLTFMGRNDFIDITGEDDEDRRYLKVTKEITHIESIDIVFGPGTKNARFREVLSALGGKQMNKCEKCGVEYEGDTHTCATTEGGEDKREQTSQPEQLAVQEAVPQAPVGWQLIGPNGQKIEVPNDQLGAIPAASDLPEVQFSQLSQQYKSLEAKFDKLAATLDANAVTGNGRPVNDKRPKAGDGQTTQTEMVMRSYERMMGLNVSGRTYRFNGLKHMYFQLTGDYDLTGRYNPEAAQIKLDPQDVYGYLTSQADDDPMMLAYNPSGNNADTTTMAELTRNVMNKVMIDQLQFLDEYQWWQRIAKIEDFNTLQQISWVRLGGIGDLPTVAEKAEYTQLAWDDARTTADWEKRGGYLPLSLEMIDRDDLAGWRAAPRNLITSAVVTLSGEVSDLFTDNTGTGPSITTEGSTANLFSATFNNLLTQALTADNWSLAVQTMYELAQFNVSGRAQAVRPRYLLIPVELEMQGVQAASQANDVGSFNDLRPRKHLLPPENVITVPDWTNADNWAAVADPMRVPICGVGFRFGRNPELFVEPSTTGLMFFNDVMPIKVRWFFAVSAIDPRGAIKSNVG